MIDLARIPRRWILGITVGVALLLVWRVVVTGSAQLLEGSSTTDPDRVVAPLDASTPDRVWRERLARNPTDYVALVVLGLQLERQGKIDEARSAMREAMRLAPASRQLLLEAAAFHLRVGEEAPALAILRRAVDLYPEVGNSAWPVFVAVLDAGRGGEFFALAAKDNPDWWPAFFGHACAKAVDVNAVERVFAARAATGMVTPGERSCVVGRLQRENRWANAYQVWLNSLPAEQRQRVPYVFNGGFELPLTNLGFDWLTPTLDGVAADAQPIDGATGRRALRVEFVNKRWAGPPVLQYLMLFPGKYELEGRSRSDGLETWLGVQWGLYCVAGAAAGAEARQLARTDRFLVASEWESFREAFVVPKDCPVQLLRLELANPRRDADTPGNVAARLRGTVWFDDFRVRSLD